MREDNMLGYGIAKPTKKQWQLVVDHIKIMDIYLDKYPARLPPIMSRDDIVHDVLLPALVRAAKAYDPKRRTPFGYYAWAHFAGAVVDARKKLWSEFYRTTSREQIEDAARQQGQEGNSSGLDPRESFQEPSCRGAVIDLLTSKLRPPHRYAIDEYYFGEQLGDRQIGDLVGLTEVGVWTRRHKALRHMQKIAARHGWTVTDFI